MRPTGLWRAALCAGLIASLGLQTAAAVPPDPVRGEQLYNRCAACHALASDRVGPRHCGVVGRRAGSVAGFAYSPAMKKSKLQWNVKTLDRFLTKPMSVVPGTSMTYDGVPLAQDRSDLIAYLQQAAASSACK